MAIKKTVILTEDGESILINRPLEELVREVSDERRDEDEQIRELITQVSVDESTIKLFEQFPAGRAVKEKYARDLLSTRGSEGRGGRFNFKAPGGHATKVLYLADGEETALMEGTGSLKPRYPYQYAPLNVELQKVWDLRGEINCKKNNINYNKLMNDWQYAQDILKMASYSQEIGCVACNHDEIEAVCYDSKLNEKGYCLAIFVDKLLAGSYVQIIDRRPSKPVTSILRGTKPLSITD